MTFPDLTASFHKAIPVLRGKLEANVSLDPLSWFRTGGKAQLLFTPLDEDDLALFMRQRPSGHAAFVRGLGSNLLVRDGGVPGIVIRLGKGFSAIAASDLTLRAGAGAPAAIAARTAAAACIAGLSFLRGIPGSIGGALRLNGGAYGGETKDHFVEARAVTPSGEIVTLDKTAMAFSYRKCGAPSDLIFTEALFKGEAGDPDAILAEMQTITESRSSTQPVNTLNGGSTFKNPPGHSAWKLVDEDGCRGLTIGGAQVSTMHTNFLVNLGAATAADIETLGETVREKVKQTSGVELEWEIKRIGVA